MSMDDIDFEGIARKIAESDSRGPTSRIPDDAEKGLAAETDVAALTARIVADERAKSADLVSSDVDEEDAADEDWGDGWGAEDEIDVAAAEDEDTRIDADLTDGAVAEGGEETPHPDEPSPDQVELIEADPPAEVQESIACDDDVVAAEEVALSEPASESWTAEEHDTVQSEVEEDSSPEEGVTQDLADPEDADFTMDAAPETETGPEEDAPETFEADAQSSGDEMAEQADHNLSEPLVLGAPEANLTDDEAVEAPQDNDETQAIISHDSDENGEEEAESLGFDAEESSDINQANVTANGGESRDEDASTTVAAVQPKMATPEMFPTGSTGDPDARRPRICLMGEFSAGKSTLSNLLIGARSLPVNVTATQLPPVWISWGDRAPYRVDIDGERIPVDLNHLEAVPVEQTSHIRIFRKSDLLEICDLIDMPGISDPNMSAEVWQRVLPKADAVIWCTHATQAWRQSEAAVWDTMPRDIQQKSILLLTRMDKIRTDRDRARVMRRVGKETEGLFRAQFGVSLMQALAAGDDEDAWRESGAEDFAVELVKLIREIQVGLADPDVIARQEASATSTSLTRRPAAPAMPASNFAERSDDGSELPGDVQVRPSRVRPRSLPAGRERSDRRRSSDLRL